jgi:hypothetical protein
MARDLRRLRQVVAHRRAPRYAVGALPRFRLSAIGRGDSPADALTLNAPDDAQRSAAEVATALLPHPVVSPR